MADNFKIDRTDFGILEMLMEDAGLSNKQIAAGVDLAPSSCHERVKALRSKGILLGSHAEVDYRALGLALEALLFVQVAKLAAREVDDFVRETWISPRGAKRVSGVGALRSDCSLGGSRHGAVEAGDL